MAIKATIGSFFQSLGKTFMLPVALLAAMGLLLGIGSGFSASATIERLPFLGLTPIKLFFEFITAFSSFAFTNLAALFALAIPIGLARQEKGTAGFSGFTGFMVLNLGVHFMLNTTGTLCHDIEAMRAAGQKFILGIQTIDTGVLGGIIVGLITAKLHNKFYTIQLPNAFSFFGGARFVPIITAIVTAFCGLLVPVIWPLFSALIRSIGFFIQKAGIFAPWIFFSGERLFLPFGLHHILVALVRFTEIGGIAQVNGETVYGALNIFYKEFAGGLPLSHEATRFLSQGKMPSFLFGLPAAALAMYTCAFKERKPLVKGLFLSSVVSCMVGGITEPIEFLFLFISPPLYVFHALMTGLGAMAVSLLGVTIGNTDGNILDFLIFGVLQGTSTKWFMLFVVGPIWFAAYYFVFKIVITKKDLKTPGREILTKEDAAAPRQTPASSKKTLTHYTAAHFIEALGGKENFVTLDNCVTRLRLILKDTGKVDESRLKENGALAIIKQSATDIQVVIGPQVHILKQQMERELGQ